MSSICREVDMYTAMPYKQLMYYEFIELAPFAAERDDLFPEEQFLELQWHLCRCPEAGEVIPATGGCCELRRKSQGKGKRKKHFDEQNT